MSNNLYIIGIGYKPLDKGARDIILNSSVILASKRLFEVFKGYDEFREAKDKLRVINNVDETINLIHSLLKETITPPSPIVLLASGDPMFFGIGRRAVKEFGKEMVEILPDLSSIQTAFSKIKEPWDDAFLMSLHGGPDPEKRRRLPYEINDIPSLLQRHNKIAILTDKENNPSEIAKELLKPAACSYQLSAIKIYVCEKLGYEDERITEGTPDEISAMTFGEPNVVIIIREQEQKPERSEVRFGLNENEIIHSNGLITKDEVRAVAIHKLRLPQKGVFWDIGAGSGSVSIEAARLCPELEVFAVEKDAEQIQNITCNKDSFGLANMRVMTGEAPDVLKDLPSPDRVFIGGSGGKLNEIIKIIAEKMSSGIIVINAATIETTSNALSCLEQNGFQIEASQVSVSRMKNIGKGCYFSALNPIFVITGQKAEMKIPK